MQFMYLAYSDFILLALTTGLCHYHIILITALDEGNDVPFLRVGWFWLGFNGIFPPEITDRKNDKHCAIHDLANIR